MYAGATARPIDATDQPICDLRSDTVTQPDAAMRQAMANAEVGDDVYGDDPTVKSLEAELAERLGKEAGLFLTSGTQSNLVAMLSHCQRGEEVITGSTYHTFLEEAAGASVLGSISLRPIPLAEDAALEAAEISAAIQPDDSHRPISRLLSLENTVSGRAIPLARMAAAADVARQHSLAVHLDGARFFNAVHALNTTPATLASLADTVSICLSKGLGAPAGSVLLGPADVVARARRWRKMLGGGMRQTGLLAAAGRYALTHNVARLKDDHARATSLANTLRSLGANDVEAATNMVFFSPRPEDAEPLRSHMLTHGILIGDPAPRLRIVLHKDIDDAALARLQAAFTTFYG